LEDNDDIPSTKKQKTEQSRPPNPNTWHPKLLAALADPLKRAGIPSHSKILKYCEATAQDIVPQGSKICASNYFFGKCYDNKACKKIHQVATDEDAEKILKLCDKFIRDPVPLKSSFKKDNMLNWVPSRSKIPVTEFLSETCTDAQINNIHNNFKFPQSPRPATTSTTESPPIPPSATMTPEEQHEYLTAQVKQSANFPEEIPVQDTIGKLGLMCPQGPYAVKHDAIPLLNSYANEGCPVDAGPDWSREKIELLLKRGPHISAKSKAAIKQLRAETHDKIKHKYARIVTWGEIKSNLPKKLKISPVAMIPHKSKQFRCILDLSFQLFFEGKKIYVSQRNNQQKSKKGSNGTTWSYLTTPYRKDGRQL
jgi:hypothetical protein